MAEIVAYCGLRCDTCNVLLATLEPDADKKLAMKRDIIRLCHKMYGMDLQPEDISDCDGCKSEGGRLFEGCQNCEIRSCAKEKGHENCAGCDSYPCQILLEHFSRDPESETRLNEIRETTAFHS